MNSYFLEQTRLGNVYHAHNVTKGLVTILSATCTGLVLENPFGSGREFVVASMAACGADIAAIREIGIAVSSEVSETLSTSRTAAVIHNGRPGGSNVNKGVAFVSSIATLPTVPVWFRPLANCRDTTGVDAVESNDPFVCDFDGTVIVPPGHYICFSALDVAASNLLSIIWAETDERFLS